MTVNDREWRFYRDAVGKNETYNDLFTRYLRELGLTGTLQDMIPKYRKNRIQLELSMRVLSDDDGNYLYDDDNTQPVETY